ncbi:nitrate- and nitrite sensing domain-containing protein [Kitasatospora sp. NPDC059577]|uniref:sensor histidine kinase n=1 Tax=Kitasatospora sp. NPDC059577 TaxID=3346873 RepID=UPI00367A32BD
MREDRGAAPGARRGAHPGPSVRPPHPGAWLRGLRPRTVRARIIALLMVPVVSIIALWGFATVTAAQGVWDLLRQRDAQRTVLTPVAEAVAGLQAERTAAGQLLAASATAPTAARETALREASAVTDRAITPLFPDPRHPDGGYNRADAQGLGADAAARLDALGAALAVLPELRAGVLARSVGWPEVYAAYGEAVDRALAAAGAVAPQQEHAVADDVRVLLELARSRELLAREDALLRAARFSGALGEEQLREFSGTAFARREFERGSAADLGPADREALLAVTGGRDHRELVGYEDLVRAAADGRAAVSAVPADRWAMVAGNVESSLRAVEDQAGRVAAERRNPYALGLFTPAGTAVLLGLLGVVASLVISVQIGRGLVTELIGLRNEALELAGRKLPSTMRKLRAGEEVDVETEAPRPAGRDDEIGQVHRALGTVQRAAVTAAVERAEVLSGVSGVFVNLARRSQVLVHRQLTLLDAMERRTEDPSELADLFRLDHLTTRMRRHAEGLIILSGAAPGRAWRKPVPLVDVVRAAVSEVEEYARVEVHPLPRAAVVGHAVADLAHLVAELVENATGFSPPHTRVHIRGEQVGNGYALEIEDRGLGMGPEALNAANRRIAAAERTDLFDSDRLGLFVVSRLARRQDVRISLVTSAYGGITAVVLLPTALLADGAAVRAAGDRYQPYDPVVELDVRPGTDAEPVPVGSAHPGRPDREFAPTGGNTPRDAGETGLPAVGGPPPEGGALLPFGVRGNDPGPVRRAPLRASGARRADPAADGGRGAAARPQSGPPQPNRTGPEATPAPGGRRPDPGPGELPRRTRQASLVPQLRGAPGPGVHTGRTTGTAPDPATAPGTGPSGRSSGSHGAGSSGRGSRGPERLGPDGLGSPEQPERPGHPGNPGDHERPGHPESPENRSPENRSPEAARAAVAAFRNGWVRGLRPDGGRSDRPADRPTDRFADQPTTRRPTIRQPADPPPQGPRGPLTPPRPEGEHP